MCAHILETNIEKKLKDEYFKLLKDNLDNKDLTRELINQWRDEHKNKIEDYKKTNEYKEELEKKYQEYLKTKKANKIKYNKNLNKAIYCTLTLIILLLLLPDHLILNVFKDNNNNNINKGKTYFALTLICFFPIFIVTMFSTNSTDIYKEGDKYYYAIYGKGIHYYVEYDKEYEGHEEHEKFRNLQNIDFVNENKKFSL